MDNQQCTELKNIQYKSMLLSKNTSNPETITIKTTNNIDIDKFLDDEKNTRSHENWNKMDKTFKIKKLYHYAEKYCLQNNHTENCTKNLKILLKSHLDKKRLNSTKEVDYNKDTQEIDNIPNLTYKNKRFCIERTEKRISTTKSLAPKKTAKKKKSRKKSPKIVIKDDNLNSIKN